MLPYSLSTTYQNRMSRNISIAKPHGAFEAPLITAFAVGGKRKLLYEKTETEQAQQDSNL